MLKSKYVEEEGNVKGKVVLGSLRSADDGDLGTVAGQCLGHTLADTGSATYIDIQADQGQEQEKYNEYKCT